jgi:pilus assembly protein CpaB
MLMLGLALLLAAVSVYLARGWLQSQAQLAGTTEDEPLAVSQVVLASVPMQFGTVIREEHLKMVNWPEESVPEGAFTSFEELLGDGTEERIALRAIETNEPILKPKVSGFGARASLSVAIDPDMRAFTISVNAIHGVAGFVLPGDRVDVLLTRKRSGDLITDILLQNMKVLATDQDSNEAREGPKVSRSVTLEVTPAQAQKLVLAQEVGTLSLALRHIGNAKAEAPQTVSIADLTVGEANEVPSVEPNTEPSKAVIVPKEGARGRALSQVRITRGLTTEEVEVTPEHEPRSSKPAARQETTRPRSDNRNLAEPQATAPTPSRAEGAPAEGEAVGAGEFYPRAAYLPTNLLGNWQ